MSLTSEQHQANVLAYNAAGDAYRDKIVEAVRAAGGRELDPKAARAAGGFLVEHDGDVDAALRSAIYGCFEPAAGALASYKAARAATQAEAA